MKKRHLVIQEDLRRNRLNNEKNKIEYNFLIIVSRMIREKVEFIIFMMKINNQIFWKSNPYPSVLF